MTGYIYIYISISSRGCELQASIESSVMTFSNDMKIYESELLNHIVRDNFTLISMNSSLGSTSTHDSVVVSIMIKSGRFINSFLMR